MTKIRNIFVRTITVFTILIAVGVAYADVVLPPAPQRPLSRWAKGEPILVKKSNGCGTANVCLGYYESLGYGFHGEVAVVVMGHAFCNSVDGVNCPTSDACIADEKMDIKKGAPVIEQAPVGRVVPGSATESSDAN